MNTKILDARDVGTELRRLLRTSDKFMWSVAWATGGPHVDALMQASSRLEKLAVGIDFYQTDPDFLERLIPISGARYVPKLGAVFTRKSTISKKVLMPTR